MAKIAKGFVVPRFTFSLPLPSFWPNLSTSNDPSALFAR